MELVTPVGRLVQGSIALKDKMDPQTNKPKLDEHGQPIKEMFIAVAFSKTDPNVAPLFNQLYQNIYTVARTDFPHLFDAQGKCVHPGFAWKIQDGDGVDSNGKSVADKPGWAGHWIIKMQTQYLPKCFHYGKYDPTQQITDPTNVIKCGYFVRVAMSVRGNGVKPDTNKKPGLFISPQLIELCGFGEEIQSGPDANKVLGGAGAIALPAGASAAPVIAAPGGAPVALAPPPQPGAVAMPLPGVAVAAPVALAPPPGAPAAMPMPAAPGAMPPPPPPAAGPQMTAKAQGFTYDQMKAQGWTDETLRQHGYMV